jgi:hypothetical protein
MLLKLVHLAVERANRRNGHVRLAKGYLHAPIIIIIGM